MIELFQYLLMMIGAVTAVGFVTLCIAALVVAIGDVLMHLICDFISSRRDTKLFNQIEEYRRDFS